MAKVHRQIYGDNIDDPLLGGFMDAFCDVTISGLKILEYHKGSCLKKFENRWLRASPEDEALHGDRLSAS